MSLYLISDNLVLKNETIINLKEILQRVESV